MVVDNLHVVCVPDAPAEADAPLIVDTNAVLTCPGASEFLETIARRDSEVCQPFRCVQDQEPAERSTLNLARKPSDRLATKESLGVTVAEALDHRET